MDKSQQVTFPYLIACIDLHYLQNIKALMPENADLTTDLRIRELSAVGRTILPEMEKIRSVQTYMQIAFFQAVINECDTVAQELIQVAQTDEERANALVTILGLQRKQKAARESLERLMADG